jgi:hypothetical protein
MFGASRLHCFCVFLTGHRLIEGFGGKVVGARAAGAADPKAQPMFPMAQALEYAFRDLTERVCGDDNTSTSFIAQPLGSGAHR